MHISSGKQQQDKDEQEMKEMVGRARGGFARRDAAKNPDRAWYRTLFSASHVGHPSHQSKHLSLPAGAKCGQPLGDAEQEHSPGLDLRTFPSPCSDTAKGLIRFVAPWHF